MSADDQQTIANTIGITVEDAIQLGSLETGYAYCHKEGMVLPAPVKIIDNFTSSNGESQSLDVFVSDEELYNSNSNKFKKINLSIIRGFLGSDISIKQKAVSLINVLMIESEERCITACNKIMSHLRNEIKCNDITLALTQDSAHIASEYFTELILSMMVRGVYCTKQLPNDEFVSLLEQTLYSPSREKILRIKKMLQILYTKDIAKYAKNNVVALIRRTLNKNTDVTGTVRQYFIDVSDEVVYDIEKLVKGGQFI